METKIKSITTLLLVIALVAGMTVSATPVYAASNTKNGMTTPVIKTVTRTSDNKTMTVKLSKKVSGAKGYQIQYCTDKNKTKKTIKTKLLAKSISVSSKAKTYYVRVRAYKTKNGKTVYSNWSSWKTVNHTHKWTTYTKTEKVQQYADDGTTNDYSKPIYEIEYEYKDFPVYEVHRFNGDVDVTVATANYNASHGTSYIYSDREIIGNEDFDDYLCSLGATNYSDYTKQVIVGTQSLQVGEKKVCVGYEQLGKKKEKVTYKECSVCKTTKKVK
jgi:hypothetical protein